VRAEVNKPFNTDRFPVDDHLLAIQIEDGKLPRSELEYVADEANCGCSNQVKMPGYRLREWKVLVKPHVYKTNFGNPLAASGVQQVYSQFDYMLWNVRPGLGTYFHTLVGYLAINVLLPGAGIMR
jgi:hypothetical protein